MFVEVGRLSVGDKFVYFGRRYRVSSICRDKVTASYVALFGNEVEIDLLKSQVVKVEA